MKKVAEIIEAFGGLTRMSKLTNTPYSTVKSWRDSGNIPEYRWDGIERAARNNQIDLNDL